MTNKGQLVQSADGTKIFAQAAGDSAKPAVVFIHGFSCTSLAFSKQFSDPTLLESLYLIRYDVRGHGRSEQPLEENDYESARHAEDFKAVIDTFGVRKPFVAGWSLGGIVATDVISKFGIDAIAGSILLDGMPYRSMHPQIVHPVVTSLAPGLLSNELADFAATVPKFVYSCVAEEFRFPEEDRLAWIGGVALMNPLVRQHSLARTQDETLLLAAKKTFPFLVIHGIEDRHIYIDKIENFMRGNFENVEFHEIKGAGHAAFYEKPKVVNKLILDFVRNQSGSGK